MGSEHFVDSVNQALGMKGRYCEVSKRGEVCMLREAAVAYRSHFGPEIGPLSVVNAVFWEQSQPLGQRQDVTGYSDLA